MTAYNSSVGFPQDDSDITIINPSIIHEDNDEDVNNTYVPIITRLKQANNSSENRQITTSQINNNPRCSSIDSNNDYIFVDHDPFKNAKNLEEVLIFYIKDLKQESNTQLDCDKQLVTRLMDRIRPVYSNDQQKLIELNQIMEEIGLLHDKRYIEQKEKIEQLRTEICRLNKMLLSANNDQFIYNDNNNKNYSMFSTMQQRHSINDYDQWTEIEDDAKKLHEIVQSQKNQINEIVSLISQTATASTSLNPTVVSTNNPEEVVTDKQTTPTSDINIISSLLQKIHHLTGPKQQQQEPVVITTPASDRTLINHSPGQSPTQSFATLISNTLTIIEDQAKQDDKQIDDQTKQDDEQIDHQTKQDDEQPVDEQPHVPIDIPVTPPLPIEPKKCPVCSHEFASTSNDVDMYDHIEKCLFPTGIYTEPKDYECPNCNRKYPGNDEANYLQHLSDCYNRDP